MLVITRQPNDALLIGEIALILSHVNHRSVAFEILTAKSRSAATRQLFEPLHLGDRICVKALSIRGSWVRIGIDAPKEILIDREERIRQVAFSAEEE